MQELVRRKNTVEVRLNQQLQEAKNQLTEERESFRAELNERQVREHALEASKRELEAQLTAMDRENYESLQELAVVQDRLQERLRAEGELKEEKNKLLNVIKQNNCDLAKEKSALTERLQEQEQVIKVMIVAVIIIITTTTTAAAANFCLPQPVNTKDIVGLPYLTYYWSSVHCLDPHCGMYIKIKNIKKMKRPSKA